MILFSLREKLLPAYGISILPDVLLTDPDPDCSTGMVDIPEYLLFQGDDRFFCVRYPECVPT